MIIVDFVYHITGQKKCTTTTFNEDADVIQFAAEKSIEFDEFEIKRINKYHNGHLLPYEVEVVKGRILLKRVYPVREEQTDF